MLKYILFGFQRFALALFVIAYSSRVFAQGNGADSNAEKLQAGQMPYFDAVPDPIEGFNRCSWAVNDWFFRGIIYPLSFGYNFVVPKPLHSGISNAGHNLTYPVRLFNNCSKENGAAHGKKPSVSVPIPPSGWAAFLIRRPN